MRNKDGIISTSRGNGNCVQIEISLTKFGLTKDDEKMKENSLKDQDGYGWMKEDNQDAMIIETVPSSPIAHELASKTLWKSLKDYEGDPLTPGSSDALAFEGNSKRVCVPCGKFVLNLRFGFGSDESFGDKACIKVTESSRWKRLAPE